MPIDVDLSEAPQFLRFTITGEWPSLASQQESRNALLSTQQLTAQSRILVDLRGLRSIAELPSFVAFTDGSVSRVQAYLVASPEQHRLARLYKTAFSTTTHVEIFADEQAALEWVWNANPNW
jgi:hypothetical protein